MSTPHKRVHPVSRRAALIATAAVGATVALPTSGASAATKNATRPDRAVRRYKVPKHHLNKVPDPQVRHVLSRFTAGVTTGRLAEVAAAGGIDAWFSQQMSPGGIADGAADAIWSWFPSLALSPQQKWARFQNGTETGYAMMQDLATWVTLRRLFTQRHVQEMMVDFWSNLLHVQLFNPDAWVYRVDYEETIRSNAMGSFDALLNAAIVHPAMGLYLNNVESTALKINENLGRELLENHTVGLESGFSQADVVDSARILTGFQVDVRKTWKASYDPASHWIGRVNVLSFSSPNSNADGRAVLQQYLSYLAHHPATAKHLCRRLAVRFVSDEPSDAFVASLAQVYLDSDTQIGPVLQALVASDEFRGSVLAKVRTPVEDAVATWAAIGAVVQEPHSVQDAANRLVNFGNGIGQVAYDWPTPEGFPDVQAAWIGAGRLLGSMHAHWYAASGFFPKAGIIYRPAMDWMPQLPTTFDEVVDYVARNLLFLPCTPTMLEAACVATDTDPLDMVSDTSVLIKFGFPWLLCALLETTEHLSR